VRLETTEPVGFREELPFFRAGCAFSRQVAIGPGLLFLCGERGRHEGEAGAAARIENAGVVRPRVPASSTQHESDSDELAPNQPTV
jgi:hypothetical protein